MSSVSRRGDSYLARCFAGEELYGDNFSPEEIEAWFRDEEEGYYQLGDKRREVYVYGYRALNEFHGFRYLPKKAFHHVLGVGSAYGDELLPVASRASRITILEPSSGFVACEIDGTPVEYVKPHTSGILPFADSLFDLITCLGVLHHVPNVRTVLGELFRCLNPGGYALIREPVISMGDWRKPRKGLTKRERGIPLKILREIVLASGFEIIRERKCMFPVTARLQYVMRSPVYNNSLIVRLDDLICLFPGWSERYHPWHFLHKLRPAAVFFVVQKPKARLHGNGAER